MPAGRRRVLLCARRDGGRSPGRRRSLPKALLPRTRTRNRRRISPLQHGHYRVRFEIRYWRSIRTARLFRKACRASGIYAHAGPPSGKVDRAAGKQASAFQWPVHPLSPNPVATCEPGSVHVDVFQKAYDYDRARQGKLINLYPYFPVFESAQTPVVQYEALCRNARVEFLSRPGHAS